ncbi:NAD(P)/FAD-dependent oxidoreductase [Falsigemmobacter faecalis]|uniref:NAD(P)/FAD-dependent oxidoreductase n=1 Tax=Falsigemmobacter faecalis TaxID=2488730 RepID=A0A3P3DRT0_9RHOB|nr:FAD/NAD(P)-binding oxidoreductase [Falsigemmobacter faecalis]RRH76919.1 NAD(P)/FAD-dependent oxidoreductase [Falsigemmobacter faecalis]
MDVVIVGAGQAGAAAAAKLRALAPEAGITLLGAEPAAPYQRPPLSKGYLLGEMPLERLMLRAPDFWELQRIDLRTGVEVSAIDREAKAVETSQGRFSYDHLILATGSRPRRWPADRGGDLAGIYPVRALVDVDAMAPEYAEGRHVLILGGGYIGLEAAAVARKKGLRVTLVEAAPRILQRVAAPETSTWFRDLHQARGVAIIEGTGVERLTGAAGRVTGAELADGRHIACDFVILGIGILPETGLAEAAGLMIDNGIATDLRGRTSDPAIWAIGDCASFPTVAGRIRLESVPHAIDMGDCVAADLAGQGADYQPKPWFWSDQYEVKLQIAGLNTGYDRVIVRDAPPARSHWYYQGGRLLAVDAMNDPRAFMIARRLIEAGRSADPALVADPATDLKTLM